MKRRLIIILLLPVLALKVWAQKSEDILNYIAAYKELAISEMKRTGVPASIKLAQGIHETEAGRSNLVTRSNNHFGIKCKTGWAGDKVYHDDDARGECFRSYVKPEDSYMDHSDFLRKSQRYKFLFDLDPTDYEGWAYGLKTAGYATNIRYSQLLIRLIENYNLQDYSLIALGKMNDDRTLAVIPKPDAGEILPEGPKPVPAPPSYPAGQFTINKTKVVYAKSNTAWLSLAVQYDIPLSRLWDFNDLEQDDDILRSPQLVYLQLKRKVGATEFHTVQNGETVYDICQAEGIRLESLLELNQLSGDMQPADGEKLFLQYAASARPVLANEKKTASVNTSGPAGHQKSLPDNDLYDAPIITRSVATTHLVETKETLYSISKKYGVVVEKIREWNKLDDLHLKTGQALIIYTIH